VLVKCGSVGMNKCGYNAETKLREYLEGVWIKNGGKCGNSVSNKRPKTPPVAHSYGNFYNGAVIPLYKVFMSIQR